MPMITAKNDPRCGLYMIFRNTELLVKTGSEIELPGTETLMKCFDQNYARDWFSEPEKGYTAVLLEDSAPTPAGYTWIRLRELFAAEYQHIQLCSRSLALLNWRKTARFCGCCGGPLLDDKYETARLCALCGHVFFPRISPAIIILVHKGDSVLLARHAERNTDVYTCLAGFMEYGETIEECAKREVMEECGIVINNIRYTASQHWPYPDQLMIALHGDWVSGELVLQQEEIEDAKWFTSNKLPNVPKPGTVAFQLIHGMI